MNPRKILAITIALSKSQLRASRSGRAGLSFLRKPSILLILDVAAFAICTGLGYVGVTLLQGFSGPSASASGLQIYSEVAKALKEALVFIPVFVPGMVLIAGLLFELNVSSKFSASDTVNWLPITQAEYVIASALSVAYNYSISVAIALGITLAPSVYLGYGWAWAGVALVSVLTLFTGGALVEILRAATNRVSSVVMKRARRGALVFRLALMVVIILVFETVFNPTILITVVNTLSSSLSVFVFIPLFWGALAIEGVLSGDPLRVLVFSAGTVGFTGALVWIATRVRSRYWSPAAFSVIDHEFGVRAPLQLATQDGALGRRGGDCPERPQGDHQEARAPLIHGHPDRLRRALPRRGSHQHFGRGSSRGRILRGLPDPLCG